jgi:hypothetical protein
MYMVNRIIAEAAAGIIRIYLHIFDPSIDEVQTRLFKHERCRKEESQGGRPEEGENVAAKKEVQEEGRKLQLQVAAEWGQ